MPLVTGHGKRLSLILLLGLASASCVDEKVVFRDRELFTEPPPGAANFLGYTDEATKLTVCGNCHVNNQTSWAQTKHAGAWADLQASGHASAACENCHSVSALGNKTVADGGYTVTKDARYHDVQCENCHGPGLTHVQNPQATNVPLAPMKVDTGLTTGCGECHSGTHEPFVTEWRQSLHANIEPSPAGNTACQGCHVGEGILRAWGINSNYLEKDSLANNASAHLAIVCAVCHDPHEKANSAQLRFPIDVPSEEQNLCMKCHDRRVTPELTSTRGPHAPQGALLLGNAGWFPPDFGVNPGELVATHGSDSNPRLCATCHVNRFQVTDPNTGSFVFQATGHLFEPIPCLDSKGLPTAGNCDISARTFKSCAATGCHTEVSARSAFIAAQSRIDVLTNTLDAMIKKIPSTEFNTSDGKLTTGEGASFDLSLARDFDGSVIHNPFLTEALVTGSIKQITKDYGITAPPGIVLDNILQKTRIK